MPAFIFLCDFTTEQECLERCLFGTNPGEQYQHHYSKIAVGDTLFLYNFELGLLRGPFTATSTSKMNIVPTAWKKSRRSFPWQVRVDASNVSMKPLDADQLQRLVPLAATKIGLLPPSEISDEQVTQISQAMGSG